MRKLMPLIAVLTLAVTGAALGATRSKARPDSGVFYASLQQLEGKDLYVAGNVKDKILGRGAIVYVTTPGANPGGGVLVKAKRVTIYFPNGTLSGTGSAIQRPTSATAGTLTDGKFNLNHATGALKGHTYTGKFSGTERDRTFTVHYKGTYK